jgi:chromosome partitioning protein
MIQIYAHQPISAQRPFIAQTKTLGVPVFDSYIRENKTFFADAPEEGIPLVLQNRPRHIVKELESVTSEFVGDLGI